MVIIRLSTFDAPSKALIVLAILALSFFSHNQAKPFLIEKINLFENHSLIIIIITMYLGLLNSLQENFGFNDFFISVFYILNISFTLYWIIEIWTIPFVKKSKSFKKLSAKTTRKISKFQHVWLIKKLLEKSFNIVP